MEGLDRESGAVVGWSSASAIWRREDATARRTPSVGTCSAGEEWTKGEGHGRIQSNEGQHIRVFQSWL